MVHTTTLLITTSLQGSSSDKTPRSSSASNITTTTLSAETRSSSAVTAQIQIPGLSASSIGAIAGSIGAVFAIAIVVGGLVFCYRAKSRNASSVASAEGGRLEDDGTQEYKRISENNWRSQSEGLRSINIIENAEVRDGGRLKAG